MRDLDGWELSAIHFAAVADPDHENCYSPEADRQAWSAALILAERHGLTVYDAAYMELAQRAVCP
jgi:hypothetical protein